MFLEKKRRVLVGEVIRVKNSKTIAVRVETKAMHPIYQKLIKTAKVYQVHDEKGKATLNDRVSLVECRPISKTKHFRLKNILNSNTRPIKAIKNRDVLVKQKSQRESWIQEYGIYYAYRFKKLLEKARASEADFVSVADVFQKNDKQQDKKSTKARTSTSRRKMESKTPKTKVKQSKEEEKE